MNDERALLIANLRYALTCHAPAMKHRVRIQTGYGTVDFHGPQARKITALCEELLRKQLERLERKGRPRRCAVRWAASGRPAYLSLRWLHVRKVAMISGKNKGASRRGCWSSVGRRWSVLGREPVLKVHLQGRLC